MGNKANPTAAPGTGTDPGDKTQAAPAGRRNARPAAGGPTSEIELVRFDLLRSAVYHGMRERTQLRWQRVGMFLTIILGSSAFAAFWANASLIGQIASGSVAVIGAGQLVFDFGGTALQHADLRRRFYDLLAEAESIADIADIKALRAKMAALYADEPPEVERVNRKAHNRAGESLWGDDYNKA